ncbi:hypothetical protein COBT_000258 [Conglomerata obtusa]
MQSPFHKRIQKEVAELLKNPLPNVRLSTNSMNDMTVEITGADGTLYANEKYVLAFKLPKNYPIEAPEVIFVGNIPVNEHIYSNGHICLSILYDQWSPALTIESVCLSIISLLSSAEKKLKPVNDDSYCKISRNKSPKDFKWSYHGK